MSFIGCFIFYISQCDQFGLSSHPSRKCNVVSVTPFLQHHHILNQWDVLFHVLCITRATTNDSILINGYKMSGNSQFPGA